MDIEVFLKSVVSQNETEMRRFFHKTAIIKCIIQMKNSLLMNILK